MTADENKEAEERRPITIGELRRRAICKKRYGRASLTIRRWGGWGHLAGDSALAKKLTAFRAGEATAEELAWAFVRVRVESRSPTFRWKDADLERLIRLVTDCSESPRVEATTAEELAQELVKAQDQERESLKRLSEQFSRIFATFGNLPKAFAMPQFTRWAEQQQRTFAALSRSFVMPRLTAQLAGFPAAGLAEQMGTLGLTASARRQMFPVLQPTVIQRLAGLPSSNLLAQRIRLPDATYGDFSKSLERSLALYRTQSVAPALSALSRHQSFTIGEVLTAAREAAELAEQEGEREEAADLVALSAEAVEVIESPSTEKLEQMVADLSERLNERLDDLEAKQDANEEKREGERKDDLTLTLFLWFLSIYLAYFLWLLDHLPKE